MISLITVKKYKCYDIIHVTEDAIHERERELINSHTKEAGYPDFHFGFHSLWSDFMDSATIDA